MASGFNDHNDNDNDQSDFMLFTPADVSYIFSSRPPGGVMMKVLTPLTVLSSCVVQTHTSTVNLKNIYTYIFFDLKK